ncbi:MAG: hypothetical protein ABR562_09785, partial [Thermoplasmatota archaeon]
MIRVVAVSASAELAQRGSDLNLKLEVLKSMQMFRYLSYKELVRVSAIAETVDVAAETAWLDGDAVTAARLLGAADEFRARRGMVRFPSDVPHHDAVVDAVREALAEAPCAVHQRAVTHRRTHLAQLRRRARGQHELAPLRRRVDFLGEAR